MKLAVILLFLTIFNLEAQQFSKVTKSVFTQTGNSTAFPFDVDKDGYSDVFTMGKNGTSYYSKIYRNNGDSTFLDLGISMPGLAYGDADVMDFNNDGFQDIAICGYNGVTRHFHLYRNLKNNLFQEMPTSIPGVDYSRVKCADINKDGWTDIILMGQSSSAKIFNIYKNNGNGTFSFETSLEGLYDGSFQIIDMNNDSYPDIIATGVNNSYQMISKIYIHSNTGFVYTERASNLPPTRGGSISSFDFDTDGYTDLVITGNNSDDEYIAQVYKNNSGLSFTLFSQLEGLYYSNSLTADFNNDGYPDVFLSGVDINSLYKSIYYTNNAGTGFNEQITNLPGIGKGCFAPIDLTNDNKLDVLVSGFAMAGPVTGIYNNELFSQNTAPGAPQNLTSISQSDSVILRWNKASDAQTLSAGLTYDFYIKASDEEVVYSIPADFNTGGRSVNKQGQVQDTFAIIKNMPYGKYFWCVQAVDQSYKGSSFAPLAEFNICNNLNIGLDTSVCRGNDISLTTGNSTDIVTWYSSANPTIPYYVGNTSSFEAVENLTIWVTVSTTIGCFLSDTIVITMLPLPEPVFAADTSVCFQSNLLLSLNQNGCLGDWSSTAGSIEATGISEIDFEVLFNDTIFVQMTNTNGCINYDTLILNALPLPDSFLRTDTSGCYKNTLVLNAGVETDSVFWSDNNGNFLSAKNELNHYITQSEKLFVKIIDLNQCVNFDTISIISLPLPEVNAGNDTLICPGSSVVLGDVFQENCSYKWFPSTYLDYSDIAQPTASPEATTEFVLEITDENSCINYDSVILTVNPQSIVNAGGDKFICPGGYAILGGNPTASGSLLPYSFQWFPDNSLDYNNIENPTATPDSNSQYTLVVYTGNCIVDTLFVTVTVFPLPTVNKSEDINIGYLENTQIWANGGSVYKWLPEAGLNDNTISDPIASPEVTTLYTVFVTDTNGCESTAQVLVTIENKIFVPNLFTPNGDGKNDYFLVYGTGIAKIHFSVFSTEGIKVYETTDVEEATKNGWDGEYQGKMLNPGRYLWSLDAISTDGNSLLFNGSNKGIITLLK